MKTRTRAARRVLLWAVACGMLGGPPVHARAEAVSRGLRVSENHRYLEYQDGTPFFYLGDTAWERFHRLNRAAADRYLANRAAKGFTVIQAVVLAELDGLDDPNPYGDKPLIGNDPAQPNEAYFRHVDYVVRKAGDLGLFIGMLPTWFDPRYAVTEPIHTTDTPGFQTFVPPTCGRGCDWLLVLGDATASFGAPGQPR